jgi:hypothetical protein
VKTRDVVSAAKLRGGFYSPPGLVRACLDRIAALVGDRRDLAVLEPSAGDGAFIRGLAGHPLGGRVAALQGVELEPGEAAACRTALASAGLPGAVATGSFLPWALACPPRFDAAVGNPPYLRYQFVDPADRAAIAGLAARAGVPLAGVANLWLPVLLGALGCLREGGAFAFIVPSEIFTGTSAAAARAWLAAHADALRTDLFPPGSFPGALQEVVVLSGIRRVPGAPALRVVEGAASWTWPIDGRARTWTRALLPPRQRDALAAAEALPAVSRLSALATFEVAIVTGANAFFSVDAATAEAHGLRPWTKPLLPRIRHAPGLVFAPAEHAALAAEGHPAHLLHFAADLPDPRGVPAAASYLAAGEAEGLPARHKCAIREPWFRVPHVRAGRLLLSKRSHRYPRVVLNEAGVYTTDTIYRGTMRPPHAARAADLVAGFHNSLTLLSAEVEGRSFGGGVLELVPGEVGRLAAVLAPGAGEHLARLDGIARAGDPEALVAATDGLLARAGLELSQDLLAELAEARASLLARRLARG